MTIERLTDRDCRAAEPGQKEWKLADGGGLSLHILPSGSKVWRFRFRSLDGKVGPMIAAKEPGKDRKFQDQTVVLGRYDDLSLAGSRKLADNLRRQIAEGVNPILAKREEAVEREEERALTFAQAAEAFVRSKKAKWSETHHRDVRRMLDHDLLPALGEKPICDISKRDLNAVLDNVAKRREGKRATGATYSRDVLIYYGVVVKHANKIRSDRLPELRDVSKKVSLDDAPDPKSHPHLKPGEEIGAFMAALTRANSNPALAFPTTLRAMRFLILTAARTRELRFATWSEIDLSQKLWRLERIRMKKRKPHTVALSDQACALLIAQRADTGDDRDAFVFPSPMDRKEALSENALLALLKRMGYHDKTTSHGMRSSFSMFGHETAGPDWSHDAVEMSLSHSTGDAAKAAYQQSELLPARRKLMQAWADAVDQWEAQASGANVVKFPAAVG